MGCDGRTEESNIVPSLHTRLVPNRSISSPSTGKKAKMRLVRIPSKEAVHIVALTKPRGDDGIGAHLKRSRDKREVVIQIVFGDNNSFGICSRVELRREALLAYQRTSQS